MDFKVGDLVRLKDYPNDPLGDIPTRPRPVAIVVSIAAAWLNRMQIEYICNGSREMMDPRYFEVVSKNETR